MSSQESSRLLVNEEKEQESILQFKESNAGGDVLSPLYAQCLSTERFVCKTWPCVVSGDAVHV